MTTTTTNSQYSLNVKDLARGLLIAVITATLTGLLDALNAGGLETVNWKAIGVTGLTAGVAYLVKNFFTPSEIVIQNAGKSTIEAVKNGDAKTTIVSTPSAISQI